MTPDPQTVRDTIRAHISTALLNGQDVAQDEELLMSGLIDSLSIVRLVAFLEAEYAIKVPPQDVTIDNLASVERVAAYVVQACTDRA